MSELDLFRDFRAAASEPSATSLAAAHDRVDQAIGSRAYRRRRPILNKRPLQLALALALALAIAAPALAVSGWLDALTGNRHNKPPECRVVATLYPGKSATTESKMLAAIRADPGVARASVFRRDVEGAAVISIGTKPGASAQDITMRITTLEGIDFASYDCGSASTRGFVGHH